MDPLLTTVIAAVAAFLAGFVDSVAGGGGLIQVPTLMLLFPAAPFASIAGTNKISSIFGTCMAARRYLQVLKLDRALLYCSIFPAVVGSLLGAKLAVSLNNDIVRPLVVCALFAVFVFTLLRPALGHAPTLGLAHNHKYLAAAFFGAVIGLYDGLIGPGAGSFLLFGGVVLFGLDFLAASANAKVINIATNATALAYFLTQGQYFGQLALVMAACNICGAELGALSATKKGAAYVRLVFLLVVPALIIKLLIELFC